METNHHDTLVNDKLLRRFSLVLEILASKLLSPHLNNTHIYTSEGGKGKKSINNKCEKRIYIQKTRINIYMMEIPSHAGVFSTH